VHEDIARNKRRTILLLAAFALLIAIVVVAFNFLLGYGVVGFVIAIIVAIALAAGSYWYSDRIALAATRAKPADGPEYQRYHNLVEGLCIAAGLPKPRLYVVQDSAPNAFATGRNPKHAALAVTTGLLETMNRVELEGVLAHELAHVKNYDILVSTVAVTAVGAIALLSDLGLRFMFWGGGRNRDGGSNNPAGAILAIASLALLILAPFAAVLMQFALNRRRELQADASGVLLTRYPPGLISALEKLRANQAVVKEATRATAQLWIESPLDREEGHKGSRLNRAFDTHPPLEQRIRILKEM
jgi:heat shock protein HtpX